MTALSATIRKIGSHARTLDRAWVALALIFAALAAFAPHQAGDSALFAGDALLETTPFLIFAVTIAAYVRASGAAGLIANIFHGREARMVLVAALFGALSPFCSCGVIPIIAALLSMGVPLSAVMAFWISSPLMDPSMFVLTAGMLGPDFAVAKTLAAIAIGLAGGYSTLLLTRRGVFANALRADIGDGGCRGATVRRPARVVWPLWREPARRRAFAHQFASAALFLGKWLALAFTLESLMLAYIPTAAVAALLGDKNVWAIPTAVLVGVPAYLNGYAALGLVDGLMRAGMAAGAGLAFLIAGGVTSIPAAVAVFALARAPVFLWYVGLSFAGALATGYAYQLYLGV